MAKIAEFYVELGLKKDKFDKGLKDAADAPKKLGSTFAGLGNAMTAAYAAGSIALLAFTKQSLAAYDAQAKAEAGLLTALKGRTIMQEFLIAQANEMQKVTLFDDDVIIQAQKFLATMGLTTNQISKLMPLLADFSTSTGMDLVQAANLAAKAIGTGTNALGRYGVELDANMTKAQKTNEILKVLQERYGGQAAEAAKVGTSALAQLSKAWGEVAETVGKHVAPAFTVLAETLTKYLTVFDEEDPNEWVNQQITAFGKLDEAAKRSKIAWWFKQAKDAQADYIKYIGQAGRLEIAAQSDNSNAMKNTIEQTAHMIANKKREIEQYAQLIKGIKQFNEVTGESTEEVTEHTTVVVDMMEAYGMAHKSLMQFVDGLNTEKVSIDELLLSLEAYQAELSKLNQTDAYVKYSGGLERPEDEPYVDDIPFNTENLAAGFDEMKGMTKDFTSEMNGMLSQFVADTVITLSDGLADVITGDGSFDDVFKNILASFGAFLQEMGAALVTYGIAMEAFAGAMSNPIAAVMAGAALIVAGGVISNLSAEGPSTVGMTGGGGGYSGSSNNNSLPITGNSDLSLRTEISGSDLAFILERAKHTSQRNGRF